MLRVLNIVAILSLMGSAVYAYTIKYATAYRAEQIAKTKIEIKQERDAIAVLRAEWAFMTRPERLQQLVDAHLSDMKQIDVHDIVAARQLPDKGPRIDSIGQKLDALLGAPETTSAIPQEKPAAPKAVAPKAVTPKAAAAPKTTMTTTTATPKPAAPAKTSTTSTTTAPKPATTAKAQPSGQKKL